MGRRLSKWRHLWRCRRSRCRCCCRGLLGGWRSRRGRGWRHWRRRYRRCLWRNRWRRCLRRRYGRRRLGRNRWSLHAWLSWRYLWRNPGCRYLRRRRGRRCHGWNRCLWRRRGRCGRCRYKPSLRCRGLLCRWRGGCLLGLLPLFALAFQPVKERFLLGFSGARSDQHLLASRLCRCNRRGHWLARLNRRGHWRLLCRRHLWRRHLWRRRGWC